MDTNKDIITLKEQRMIEHDIDLEMIRYYFPVEKKWNTIARIFTVLVVGYAIGSLCNLLMEEKKSKVKKIVKEVFRMIQESGYEGEVTDGELEDIIKRAIKKVG